MVMDISTCNILNTGIQPESKEEERTLEQHHMQLFDVCECARLRADHIVRRKSITTHSLPLSPNFMRKCDADYAMNTAIA